MDFCYAHCHVGTKIDLVFTYYSKFNNRLRPGGTLEFVSMIYRKKAKGCTFLFAKYALLLFG